MKKLSDILKDSNYSFALFSDEEVKALEDKITLKNDKPYIECVVREREIMFKPEEVVRQLYASKLINEYGYPKDRMKFEHYGVAEAFCEFAREEGLSFAI